MAISSKEISEVIKQRLKDFDAETVTASVGRVISVGDGIAQIYGLTDAMAGELLQFLGGVPWLVSAGTLCFHGYETYFSSDE